MIKAPGSGPGRRRCFVWCGKKYCECNNPPLTDPKPEVEITVPLKEIQEFYFQSCEEYHLWDEEQEKKPYPILRQLEALKKFIESKKPIT